MLPSAYLLALNDIERFAWHVLTNLSACRTCTHRTFPDSWNDLVDVMKNRSFQMRGQECCDPYCFGSDNASAVNFFCNCYTAFITSYVLAMTTTLAATVLFFHRHRLGGDGIRREASLFLIGWIVFGALVLAFTSANCSGGSSSSGAPAVHITSTTNRAAFRPERRPAGRNAGNMPRHRGYEDLEDQDSEVHGQFSTDVKVKIYGTFSLVLCVLSHWWVWNSRRPDRQTGPFLQ